ncbi:hypothetical protein GPECTOR_3g30 [Gonium pectorale]|uniref:LsmAD domain-containing protein n=1 Tax=Gonium pectorale TaxID=33097 RepID=A0A150GZ89_GONPE|nr:hypothetical protein GPECTOR_3g30 [Gonium pectorale]|eukprot:KXZ55151.1 hypothetical protein GPECTOR_3g30 [Gonium pectorale]
MSTFAAKLSGGGPRAGPQAKQGQTNGANKSAAPARQTVGFSVASSPDRLGFVGNVLVGYKVELQVSSGMVYEGVFGSLQTDGATGHCVVLKYAKVIKDPGASTDRTALAERPVPVLTIPIAEVVQVFAKDVRFSPEDLSGADRSDVGFETDAAISRGRGGGVRELQRWQPDEGDDSTTFNLESTGDSGGVWDQFAVNRDRFGVQTTWDEHFYTTKIKRGECRITDEEAARIAREIETGASGPTTNIHMLEERGGELAPDVDEEALYGAVIRDHQPAPAPGPYVPPHQQQRQQQRSRAPQQSAADRAVAWGRAGSGVAAVAAGLSAVAQHQQQQHPHHHHPSSSHLQHHAGAAGGKAASAASAAIPVPARAPPPAAAGAAAPDGGSGSAGSSGATAPIDIDARKEVNKVRSSLTVGPKKDRSSPFGTPKLGMSRSPVFASPLVADPVSFSALDLDPGAPQVKLDPEAQAEFLRFKEEMNKKRSGQMGAEAALADLKKASFKDRSSSSNGTAAASAAAPTGSEPASAAASGGGAAGDGTAAAASSPAAAASGGEEAKPKVVSKLNPNAKPFSLNINAKEFVPSFSKPTMPAAVSTGGASVAATAAPSPAASAAASNAAAAAAAAAAASASNAAAAPTAVAAAAAQAATVIANSQASYLTGGGGPHGLTVTYHHSNAAQGHGGPQGIAMATQYGHSAQGAIHVAHGHGAVHHERGYGAGAGGPMGRELREHGGVYHRNSDPYRGGGGGGNMGDGGGYRGGGEHFRNAAGSGSGDGYHHHQHHHKAGGGPGEHHGGKGPDGHAAGGGGLHKVPPPPPQGPMSAEGPMQHTMITMNSVAQAAMTPHGIVPMTPAMAGMPSMGAVPYGVVMAPPGSAYMTSAMPPGTVAMASTPSGPVPIMYAVRPAGGGPAMAMAPAGMAMMGAPGMGGPYGAAVGPYMTAPGGLPPPSPTGRAPSTGFFQPAGAYPMMAAAHPGGPHAHPGGPMGGQPGAPMGGHHMMQGPGHAHGHGHMVPHMQDGRGPGGMGPKGGGRQGGGGHRPPRMDHDRVGPGPRDME